VRYRHTWPGFLLLGSLALLLGALLVWGDHFLSPGPSGGIRRLLQLWAASRPPREAGQTPEPERATAPSSDTAALSAPPDERAPLAGAPEAAPPGQDPPEPTPPGAAGKIARAAPAQPRYALDLGTFVIVEEAERAEAQLNEAGFSTVRFRQQAPERLFSVFLPPPRDAEEGRAIVARLRRDGFTQVVMLGTDQGLSLRVARAIPLKMAAEFAERLRAAGHDPSLSAEATQPGQVTLRHGTFASREEAEAVGREISRLGLPNEVVEIH
jgi:cell division septation protein DedD